MIAMRITDTGDKVTYPFSRGKGRLRTQTARGELYMADAMIDAQASLQVKTRLQMSDVCILIAIIAGHAVHLRGLNFGLGRC